MGDAGRSRWRPDRRLPSGGVGQPHGRPHGPGSALGLPSKIPHPAGNLPPDKARFPLILHAGGVPARPKPRLWPGGPAPSAPPQWQVGGCPGCAVCQIEAAWAAPPFGPALRRQDAGISRVFPAYRKQQGLHAHRARLAPAPKRPHLAPPDDRLMPGSRPKPPCLSGGGASQSGAPRQIRRRKVPSAGMAGQRPWARCSAHP
jgi:hypothetical protein